MKSIPLGIAAAALSIGLAAAQTPTETQSQPGAQTTPTQPRTTQGGTTGGMGRTAGATNDRSNAAVNTSSADANRPAAGANSFTQGEATRRIESKGFSNVSGLQKDNDGVWRGKARKDGQDASVWLDYQGNVGQQP